jgi:hypothetical protein
MSRSENARNSLGRRSVFSPASGLLLVIFSLEEVCFREFGFSYKNYWLLEYLRSPPSHNPSSLFHIRVYSVAFAITFICFSYDGAHPLVRDALAEMSETQMQTCPVVSFAVLPGCMCCHKYFSAEKSCDPDSARQPPSL